MKSKIAEILSVAFPDVGSPDPAAYFGRSGNPYDALFYSALFWPSVFEVKGAVFLALYERWGNVIEERLNEIVKSGSGLPWVQVVDSFNMFEVTHLFGQWREPREHLSDALSELGKVLVQAWYARLRAAYPERVFSVKLIPPSEDMEIHVQVHQESPALSVPENWRIY
jgi:hypothetical protein